MEEDFGGGEGVAVDVEEEAHCFGGGSPWW